MRRLGQINGVKGACFSAFHSVWGWSWPTLFANIRQSGRADHQILSNPIRTRSQQGYTQSPASVCLLPLYGIHTQTISLSLGILSSNSTRCSPHDSSLAQASGRSAWQGSGGRASAEKTEAQRPWPVCLAPDASRAACPLAHRLPLAAIDVPLLESKDGRGG